MISAKTNRAVGIFILSSSLPCILRAGPRAGKSPDLGKRRIVTAAAAPISSSYSLLRCGLLYGRNSGPVATVVRWPAATCSTRWSLPRSGAGLRCVKCTGPCWSPGYRPLGSDLKRAFVIAMLGWIDAGWRLGEFSSTGGTFLCPRGTERGMVSITPTAPGTVHEYAPRI